MLRVGLRLVVLLLGAGSLVSTAEAESVYSPPYFFTTFAGSGAKGSADGVGTAASFSDRTGITADAAGNIYVADCGNNIIRKITSNGAVTTIAGVAGSSGSTDGINTAPRFNYPRGLALDGSGNLFVAEQFNHTIRKITPTGVVTTFAGLATVSGSADGTGSAARFNSPRDVAIDGNGNIYVADAANHAIRKITSAGVVSTLAGQSGSTGSTDGVGSAARFNGPSGVAVDGAGNVYVADFGNNTIRKITPGGVVTTFAGQAGSFGSTDGTGAAARFAFPTALEVDGGGNLFVADSLNQVIRRITPAGAVTTLAGLVGTAGSSDGLGAAARFDTPYGIAVDGRGNVYVWDEHNHRMRRSVFAPAITSQPASQTVNVGGNAVFTCDATSDYPLTVQWRKDGAAIAGATTGTLTVNNVQVADAGTYTFVATNLAGATTSNPATLTVNVPVTADPVTRTVTVGSSVQFGFTGTVLAGTTFQWRKNGAAIAGATNATFIITSATLGDAGDYTVVTTNGNVTSTSNTATLLVVTGNPPTITTQPVSQTVTVGAPVQFSVSVTSVTNVTYQWRKNGAAITGGTNAVFSLGSTTVADSGTYTVAVSNAGGVVISNAATLTVNAPVVIAPVINTQPASETVTVGSPVILSVGAAGTQPLSFQWFKNGTALPGATAVLLAISSAQTGDAGSYNVVVNNNAGSVASDMAVVRVLTPPVIVTPPASRTVTVGASVEFAVSANGTLPLTFQWRKAGSAIAGATGSTYTLHAVQPGDDGGYTVTVANEAGAVTSAPATLTVTPAGPTSRLSNLSVRTAMAAGQTVIVGIAVEGGTRDVLVRAAGPALTVFGVSSVMVDPRLELFRGTTLVSANDDWPAALAPTFASAGAFALPAASRDAAFREGLNGAFSIHARGTGAGVVLVEAYDLGEGNVPRLINVSARNRVGTGDDILIAGFNIAGTGTKQLLIRAVGPGLAAFGVPGTLVDPRVEVYNSTGVKLTENDNWDAGLAATFGAVGAFALPAGSRDAALLITLPPGSYSVQVRGADGGTGEALVEVYEVP